MKKPLHIIVDGSDKMGKSSICKLLSVALKIPIVKMPNMAEYIQKDQAEEFSKLFNETIVQFKDYDFILDRGYTSSFVYSKVFDRKFDLMYVKGIHKRLKPQIFIITGNRFLEDDVYSVAETGKIDEEFCKLATERGYNLILNTDKTPDQLTNEILEKIWAKK